MKKIFDLLFSYFFVLLSVLVGAYAIKLFYIGKIAYGIVLLFPSLYLFGISCMGFTRLLKYINKNTRRNT